MIWFLIALLITGLYGMVFGSRLLWERGFVEKMQKESWKEKNPYWTEKERYNYNKYNRGISMLISGIMFVGFAIFSLIWLSIH